MRRSLTTASQHESTAAPTGGDDGADAPPYVPGFTLGGRLGAGGFSVVWAARRDADGAPVALKVGRSGADEAMARFRREREAIERVGPPHATRLLGGGRLDDGRPYLALEWLHGRTLAAELASLGSPPDPGWIAERAMGVLDALEAAHTAGVVHRDLKPSNIFIADPEQRVVLLDFGLARSEEAREAPEITREGVIAGTPAYMAPEQIRGDPEVDARADLYAFGVLLFELATLKTPFTGEGAEVERGHLLLRPPRPSELAAVPAVLEEITLGCLAKDPARRPGAAEIWLALFEVGATPSQPPASVPPTSRGSARLVGEGSQPVVLLVVDAPRDAAGVLGAISARQGFVARRRGARYVAVFSGKDIEDPARAALAAAREIVDRHSARAALHLAPVTLRSRAGGAPAAYGSAIERPEAWLPGEPWSGLSLTTELTQLLGPASGRGPSDALLAEHDDAGLLVGQEEALSALAASAAAAFDGTCPALLTVLGEVGLGKTRLAGEAARVARGAAEGALVIELQAASPAATEEVGREAARLLRLALEQPGGAASGALRDRCEACLGAALTAEIWPAIEASLGEGAPARALPLGALRRGMLRAITAALRAAARERPVAVILDDAHWACDALLDALEAATLDGSGLRLWAVVIAHPRLRVLRRSWGARNQRHAVVTLEPLVEEAGMQLAAHLLAPAEYPPAEVLRRLWAWAGGNPACLGEIVCSLKRAGAVKQRPGAGTYYLGAAALEQVESAPGWQWLAARRVDALSPELAACARICAVLGESFTRAALEGVLDTAERAGAAGSPVDAGAALEALAESGILRRDGGGRYAFQDAILQDAIYRALDPAHRDELHRHALEHLRARTADGEIGRTHLEAIARHAAACGKSCEAAAACLRLGDLAAAEHRYAEAEQRYTAALDLVAGGDTRHLTAAHLGRGRMRYRLSRIAEAREDLAGAIEGARALGDARLEAEALLEDATALDWSYAFEESARRVEEARPLVEALGNPGLGLRLRVAEARTVWRRGRVEEAIAMLERELGGSRIPGDEEPRRMARVMLAFGLAYVDRVDEAEARCAEAITEAKAAGDHLHLCAAYINRVAVWSARGTPERAIDDLQHAIEVAREIGNPELERWASYNVAVVLLQYRCERVEDALPFARRARLLEERFSDVPTYRPSLLLAEILLAMGEIEEPARLVQWIEQCCSPDPGDLPRWWTIRRVLSELDAPGVTPPEQGWDAIIEESLRISPIEGVLIRLYWRARMALDGHRWDEVAWTLQEARRRRGDCPVWRPRFDALERELALAREP